MTNEPCDRRGETHNWRCVHRARRFCGHTRGGFSTCEILSFSSRLVKVKQGTDVNGACTLQTDSCNVKLPDWKQAGACVLCSAVETPFPICYLCFSSACFLIATSAQLLCWRQALLVSAATWSAAALGHLKQRVLSHIHAADVELREST